MKKLQVLSLFSGIGAFEKALERIGVPYDIVNYCDNDEKAPASLAYSILHGVDQKKNLGDISKVNPADLEDFDLMTYGFPCNDLSISKVDGEGFAGEKSGLLRYALKIALVKKPKYLVAENVKNILSKNNIEGFEDMLTTLSWMGYNNYWAVVNATEYGVPQHRERVIIVSIRQDVDDGTFAIPTVNIPAPHWSNFIDPLDTRPLTPRQQRMIDVAKGINTDDSVKFEGKIQFESAIISLRQSGLRFQANQEHPTITAYYGTGGGNFSMLAFDNHIGGIHPRSCFKLMGFDTSDHDKLVDAGFGMQSLYILAGNSIVVNILESVLGELFKERVQKHD